VAYLALLDEARANAEETLALHVEACRRSVACSSQTIRAASRSAADLAYIDGGRARMHPRPPDAV